MPALSNRDGVKLQDVRFAAIVIVLGPMPAQAGPSTRSGNEGTVDMGK